MSASFNYYFLEYICHLEACRNDRNNTSLAGLVFRKKSVEMRSVTKIKCYLLLREKWSQKLKSIPKFPET